MTRRIEDIFLDWKILKDLKELDFYKISMNLYYAQDEIEYIYKMFMFIKIRQKHKLYSDTSTLDEKYEYHRGNKAKYSLDTIKRFCEFYGLDYILKDTQKEVNQQLSEEAHYGRNTKSKYYYANIRIDKKGLKNINDKIILELSTSGMNFTEKIRGKDSIKPILDIFDKTIGPNVTWATWLRYQICKDKIVVDNIYDEDGGRCYYYHNLGLKDLTLYECVGLAFYIAELYFPKITGKEINNSLITDNKYFELNLRYSEKDNISSYNRIGFCNAFECTIKEHKEPKVIPTKDWY